VLRQLPTAALLPDVFCVLGPGSYVDPRLVVEETERLGLPTERIAIDPHAVLVTDEDRLAETTGMLGRRIGSTCSGTGAAVQKRIARRTVDDLAGGSRHLEPYVRDTATLLRDLLDADERVVVEGPQGFGLSVMHAPDFPHVTSRDTSAAAALSEAGLSPLETDEIVLVLRAHPIRVAGNSGPFHTQELSWEEVAREGGHEHLEEFTSVTGRLRRIGRFDPTLVRRAIAINQPSVVVLNHVDYVDRFATEQTLTSKAELFVRRTESEIGREIDFVGLGPASLVRVVHGRVDVDRELSLADCREPQLAG
jgi:adenylosuccinate synthase